MAERVDLCRKITIHALAVRRIKWPPGVKPFNFGQIFCRPPFNHTESLAQIPVATVRQG